MVRLNFATFNNIEGPEKGEEFFRILARHGSAFVPEVFEGKPRMRVGPEEFLKMREVWSSWGLMWRGAKPARIRSLLTVSKEGSLRLGIPSLFSMSIEAHVVESVGSLHALTNLGHDLYKFFSPCFGFVELPWLECQGASGRPDLGFPGLAWANWIGPEYTEVFEFGAVSGLSVKQLDDSGCFVCLPLPRSIEEADASLVRMRDILQDGLPADHLQEPRGGPITLSNMEAIPEVIAKLVQTPRKKARTPKFRFVDPVEVEKARAEIRKQSFPRYGPSGFTRPQAVREILDPFETDTEPTGGVVAFDGLTPAAAKRLLELLPPGQREDALEESPTFEQLVRLGEQFPMIRFFGYRVDPSREDERISIQGLWAWKDDIPRSLISALRKSYPRPARARWNTVNGRRALFIEWD